MSRQLELVQITLIDFLPTTTIDYHNNLSLSSPHDRDHNSDNNRLLLKQLRSIMRTKHSLALQTKLMILKQIKYSNVPFVPSLKPLYDFSKDREVAMAVVTRHGTLSLSHIDPSFRSDTEIILRAATGDNFVNTNVVGTSLRQDPKFVKSLVESNWQLLREMDQTMRENEEICRVALKCNCRAIKYVENQSVLNDRSLMMDILGQYGIGLQFIGNSLKNDREIILTALKQNPNAFRFVSSDCQDEEISQFSSLVNSMELEFKSISKARQVKIYAEPNDTLKMIRERLQLETGGAGSDDKIICNGKIMVEDFDEKTLEELGINRESKLFLVYRLRGG